MLSAGVRQGYGLLRLDGGQHRPLRLTDRIAILRFQIWIATKIDSRSEIADLRFAQIDNTGLSKGAGGKHQHHKSGKAKHDGHSQYKEGVLTFSAFA